MQNEWSVLCREETMTMFGIFLKRLLLAVTSSAAFFLPEVKNYEHIEDVLAQNISVCPILRSQSHKTRS